MRTIAIRVEDEYHEVLSLLAKLAGRPLVEEVKEALDEHVARKRSETDLTAGAEAALVEMDKETAARRKALQALVSGKEASGTTPAPRGRRK